MRVKEDGSDRIAEAHILVQDSGGNEEPLVEYGSFVDPKDNAVCCYVPVDKGDILKIYGRFSGKTLGIACDAIIDGVCRKASSFAAKTVQVQKAKKLDFDSFLYRTGAGAVDTCMRVANLDNSTEFCEDSTGIVGTIELHIHVIRQLDVEHNIGTIQTYNDPKMEHAKSAGSSKIIPHFIMEFEENCTLLGKRKTNQEQKRIDTKRPGTGPWVIFRFFYRSKQSILEQKMEMTFDPSAKKSTIITTTLDMDPVPDLPIGAKAACNEGDISTRASSTPPEMSSTPRNTLKMTPSPMKKPSSPLKRPLSPMKQPSNPEKKLLGPASKFTGSTTKPLSLIPNVSTKEPVTPPSKEQSKATKVTSAGSPAQKIVRTKYGILKSQVSGETLGGQSARKTSQRLSAHIRQYFRSGDRVEAMKDHLSEAEAMAISSDEGSPKNIPEAARRSLSEQHAQILSEGFKKDGFDTDNSFQSEDGSSLSPNGAASTNITKPSPEPKAHGSGSSEQPRRSFPNLHPTKKKTGNPTSTPTFTALRPKPQVSLKSYSPIVSPTKRLADSPTTLTPGLKRPKIMLASIPSTAPTAPRVKSTSPGIFDKSLELQVAEQRERLQATRKKREEMAQKQNEVDQQMVPFRKSLIKELEKITKEMADEESALAEEEKRFKASVEMLEEFKGNDI